MAEHLLNDGQQDAFLQGIVANQRSFKAKDESVWELTEIRIRTPGGFGTAILD